jgi:hypothetical protein
MKKKEYKSLRIVVDPELLKKLDEGKYNKSKLIDSLLSDYIKKTNKKHY